MIRSQAFERAELSGLPEGGQNDRDLALAFQRGDKGSYQAIYDRYHRRVQGLCRRMLVQPEDAAEASQETFLRVYQGLARFNGSYHLGAWITRIATNVCLDHLRARRRPSTAESLEDLELDPVESDDTGPETLTIRRAESRRVLKVLAKLPPTHRAAIVLREFEGLSYDEIAVALDMSPAQVKALLHRARGGFRRAWSNAGLAALLPWRLVHRLRRSGIELKENPERATTSLRQVADAAMPTMHSVSSCSTVFQQCGQFMSERAAAMFAVAVVGGASLGGAVTASSAPRSDGEGHTVRDVDLRPGRPDTRDEPRRRRDAQKVAAAPAPVDRPSRPAAPPQKEGVSEESPQPAPKEEPGSAPQPASSPTAAPPPASPTPPPFQAAFGFARAGTAPRTSPRVNTVEVDCNAKRITQHLEGTIFDGKASYPVVADLDIRPSTANLTLRVWKDGRQIDYASWGAEPVAAWSQPSARQGAVEISGNYGPLHGSDPSAVGLPQEGTFAVSVSIDCDAGSLATQTVSLTGE